MVSVLYNFEENRRKIEKPPNSCEKPRAHDVVWAFCNLHTPSFNLSYRDCFKPEVQVCPLIGVLATQLFTAN